MEDSDGSDVEFSVLSETFQLLGAYSEAENEQEKVQKIRDHIRLIEKEDAEECPEFYQGLEWFNTSGPISIKKDLTGKLVVLDFFTYCCINCMHILPDLHRLEERFSVSDGLVVVGVHSAKFDNEKVSSNILSAILRYDITHPVVNDKNALMWHTMGIQCWPTLVLVAPNGRTLLHLIGEGHGKMLEDFVKVALDFYKDRCEIVGKDHLPIKLSKDSLPASPLLFPGKLALDESGKRLAISDTGHHRIIITDLSGIVLHSVGSGKRSLQDGTFMEACFNAPQGLVWKNNNIFVADTENHAIRQIDLDRRVVLTLAGTGHQGFDKDGGKEGKVQAISSPWDVSLGSSVGSNEEDVIFIAMAGTHQIWLYFLEDGTWLKKKAYTKGTCVRFAGNGAEENRNNNYPHAAAFAQPSGLALNKNAKSGSMLFVADSESSSIRSVSLVNGAVKAVVGGTRDPRNLFAFGDKDGKGVDAKLQHPLAVCIHNDGQTLLVADSYNHKIKTVDPETKECKTLLGSGKPGNSLGPEESTMELNEPGGLCVHTDTGALFIADTNNHCIKVYHANKGTLIELPVLFPEVKMDVDEEDGDEVDSGATHGQAYKRLAPKSAKTIRENALQVAPGSTLSLRLAVELGTGLHPTEGAPMAWQISAKGDGEAREMLADVPILRGETEDYSQQPSFPIRIPAQPAATADMLMYAEVVCYYCDEDGACRMQGLVFEVPLVIGPEKEQDCPTNRQSAREHILKYLIEIP